MSGMILKVTTEDLIVAADLASKQIDRVEKDFDQLEKLVNQAQNYWEGDGCDAYRQSFAKRKEVLVTALKRFRENVTDLQTIAGVYEEAEAQATEHSAVLPSDVIV